MMNTVKITRTQFSRGLQMSAMQLGSGSEGAIREAGGAFGKKEASQEEQYFRKLQAEQLKQLKNSVTDEIAFYEGKIKEHQDALEKAKERLKLIENK